MQQGQRQQMQSKQSILPAGVVEEATVANVQQTQQAGVSNARVDQHRQLLVVGDLDAQSRGPDCFALVDGQDGKEAKVVQLSGEHECLRRKAVERAEEDGRLQHESSLARIDFHAQD